MKARYLLIMGFLFFLLIAAVSAQDNQTALGASEENTLEKTDDEVLGKTYYYESGEEQYEDDTVVTHDVVKYYGDKSTKFKVTVYDDDYYPLDGVHVSFGQWGGKYRERTTNSNGNVYFPINYKVGSHEVETYIESDDGSGYWSAYNTVKVKSTIKKSEKQLSKESRLEINAAIAYYVIPNDVITEEIYGPYGYIDDIFVTVYVLRRIAEIHGYDFIQDIWRPNNNVKEVIDECYDNSLKMLEDKVYPILSYSGLVD